MASRLALTPVTDLPLSVKAFAERPQTIHLFPLLPLNPHSFRYSLKRKVPPPSVSRLNAVSEKVVESSTSDSTQDLEASPSTPSSTKLVLVVGGTGGVGNLPLRILYSHFVALRDIFYLQLFGCYFFYRMYVD